MAAIFIALVWFLDVEASVSLVVKQCGLTCNMRGLADASVKNPRGGETEVGVSVMAADRRPQLCLLAPGKGRPVVTLEEGLAAPTTELP